jgi:hypothetical protein
MENLFSKVAVVAFLGATFLTACDDESGVDPKRVKTFVGGTAFSLDGESESRFLAEDTSITVASEYSGTISVTTSGTDVYVLGYDQDEFLVWKNGIATTVGVGDAVAYMSDIAVVGANVYVIGSRRNSAGLYVATLWTNGVATDLSANSSEAVDIAVSGNDVYVAGGEALVAGDYFKPAYWKNGVKTDLSDPGNHPDHCATCRTTASGFTGSTNGIAVDGSNIYVTGFSDSSNGLVLWKNNVAEWVGNIEAAGEERSIAVSNGVVYIAGTQGDGDNSTATAGSAAVVFENGVAAPLEFDRVTNVAVVDGSVYALARKNGTGGIKGKGNLPAFSVLKDGEAIIEFPDTYFARSLHVAKF